MTQTGDFSDEVLKNIDSIAQDKDFLGLSNIWIRESIRYKYAHNFTWLGRPILQVPQDIYAIQELIWKIKPDLIIETGIAHGGSLIMSASMLALLDYCEATNLGLTLNPQESRRHVLGIDVKIHPHNRAAIEAHPMAHLIEMIEGSSVDPRVIDQVKTRAKDYKNVLVFLDSNHIHDHVLAELEAYAPLTSMGSYCVVWDTGIDGLPVNFYTDRPWDRGNNPKTAVYAYLKSTDCFEIDNSFLYKLLITASPDGFLRKIK
ncbi:cephalosporin hydroxylase family protein [Chloroflexota bacterium]